MKIKLNDIEKNVHKTFPPLKIEEEFIPKVNNKTRGYVKGVPFTKVSYEEFNLASRKQIAERLMMLGVGSLISLQIRTHLL